jgi:hypothetical protein
MNASDASHEAELAGLPLDPSDFALLNSLRAYYDESDPVPDGLVERIQFELTLDALHAEVATLMQMDMAGAGVRSAETEAVRTITFTSESLTTMVTLTPQPDGTVRVDGWTAPGGRGGVVPPGVNAAPGAGIRIELLLPDGPRETHADDDGRFVFEDVPSGLAKFVVYVPRGEEFSTVLSPTIEL